MPSLRQYARLVEDCERRALHGESEPGEPTPLFPPEESEQQPAAEDRG